MHWCGGVQKKNRWALVVPGLLLLELLAVVLLATGTRAAVAVLFTGDADLFLTVAVLLVVLLARGREVGCGGIGRVVAPLPPGLVVGELELQLLVGFGGCDRILLVVTVGRREDAERDGDSCFKIQVDCLGWAHRVVFLSTVPDREYLSLGKVEKKIFSGLLPGGE